jgi:hypothetical protein
MEAGFFSLPGLAEGFLVLPSSSPLARGSRLQVPLNLLSKIINPKLKTHEARGPRLAAWG